MKKTVLTFCSIIILSLILCLNACERPYSKYVLTEYSGHSEISVSSYEYCYIKLFDDGRFFFENKHHTSNVIKRQTGKYQIKDGVMTITESDNLTDYLFYSYELINFDDKDIIITANVSGITVTIKFSIG